MCICNFPPDAGILGGGYKEDVQSSESAVARARLEFGPIPSALDSIHLVFLVSRVFF